MFELIKKLFRRKRKTKESDVMNMFYGDNQPERHVIGLEMLYKFNPEDRSAKKRTEKDEV